MTRSGRRRWGARIRLSLLLVIGGGSVLAYIAVAMTINGQPLYQPFPGWVAVLQPVSQPRGDDVQLHVESFVAPISTGGDPLVSYEVDVCGPHPYRGELLIGGDAQLTDVSPGQLGVGSSGVNYPFSFRRLSHLVLTAT